MGEEPLCPGCQPCPICGRENEDISSMEEAENKLRKIINWVEAYPLSIFPEPDFKKIAEILKNNGISIDSVSASNMRHVLKGIENIIKT